MKTLSLRLLLSLMMMLAVVGPSTAAVDCPTCKIRALNRVMKAEFKSCGVEELAGAVSRLDTEFARCERQPGCLAPNDGPDDIRSIAASYMEAVVEHLCPTRCGFNEEAGACGGDCGEANECVFDPVNGDCFCAGTALICEAPQAIIPIYCKSPGQSCDVSGGLPGQCEPPIPPCGEDGSGMCNGACLPGSQCLHNGVDCRCLPDYTACEQSGSFCNLTGMPLEGFCPGTNQTCAPTNPQAPFACTCN